MVAGKFPKLFLKTLLTNPVPVSAFLCALLFYSGFVQVKDRQAFVCLFSSDQIQFLEGSVSSNPVRLSKNQDLYSADFLVTKAVTKKNQTASCKGTVSLLIPASIVEALYPGKIYTRIKETSSENCLIESGISICAEVESGGDSFFKVKRVFKTSENMKDSFFIRIRALCRLQFKRLMYGWGDAGGLLLALLTASREYTDPVLSEAFRNAGLSHILALSGMHLSLFGGLAFFISSRIARRNMADFFELAAIVFFVWFAGAGPSLIRALISAVILFINSSLRMKRFKGITVLSATFLIHLMIYPHHLKTAAFMLSYGALTGIMTFGSLFKLLLSRRFIPKLSSALSESAGAQLMTSPVTWSMFKKLTPVGIAASVAVSPLVILFLYLGLAGTFLCLLMPFLSTVFNVIMNCLYFIIKNTVIFFSHFPSIGS